MIEETYDIKFYPREGLQLIKDVEVIRDFNEENGIKFDSDNTHDDLWIEYSYFNGIKKGVAKEDLNSYVSLVLRLVVGVTPDFINYDKKDEMIELKCIDFLNLLRGTYFSSALLESRAVSEYAIKLFKSKNKVSIDLTEEQFNKINSEAGITLEEKLSNFINSN